MSWLGRRRHAELMEVLQDIRAILAAMLPEESEGEPACEHPDEPGKRMTRRTMGHHEWWCLVCGHHERDGRVIVEAKS